MEIEKDNLHACRYSHLHFKNGSIEHYCHINGFDDNNIALCNKETCDNCTQFDSKYITYPLTINGIENSKIENWALGHEIGTLVEISPCNEEYEGKTFIGIYLGELPLSIYSSYSRETGILTNSTMTNPAIFVPELKKIIYGCESWWREINSVEDFKGISKEDIDNTWYVQMLKSMLKEN